MLTLVLNMKLEFERHKIINQTTVTRINLQKNVLRFPCTLNCTLASVWLGLTIGSRADPSTVRKTLHVKKVQYVEIQEGQTFLASLSQ